MLIIKNLSVSYGERKVLKNLNLEVQKGEFVIIKGQNGAGKSTLFKAITKEIPINSGNILLDQKPITHPAKDIAHVLQDSRLGTIGSMTIAQNLSFASKRGQNRLLWPYQIKDFFKERLSLLQMGLENRLNDLVSDLSGGQRQALSLIMATLVPCKILLLDEITAALDEEMAKRIMQITTNLISKFQYTTLMITHNVDHMEKYGNRVFQI